MTKNTTAPATTVENPHNLPVVCFHRSMSNALIPHAVNPGPQLCCGRCKIYRFGSDFRRVDSGIACVYCTERS